MVIVAQKENNRLFGDFLGEGCMAPQYSGLTGMYPDDPDGYFIFVQRLPHDQGWKRGALEVF